MKADEKQNLEGVLESAIVVSWADLMRGTPSGTICPREQRLLFRFPRA